MTNSDLTPEKRKQIVGYMLRPMTPEEIMDIYPDLTYGDLARIAAQAAEEVMNDRPPRELRPRHLEAE